MSVSSPFASQLAALKIDRHSVDVEGLRTAYWSYSSRAAGNSPDLILIHGFRGDHHGLEPIVAELGPDMHVVIPDLPGFGASDDLPSPALIETYADWLAAFCRSVKCTRSTVLVGHSFGSIVVAAALSHGLPVNRAVLINPIAANALRGPRGILTKIAVLYYKLSAALPEKLGFALLKNPLIVRVMSIAMAKTHDPQLRSWIHDQHDRYFSNFSSRSGVLEAFEVSVSSDVSTFAGDISQEILMLVADKDDITALPAQYALSEKLERCQIEVVADVGHLVHYEAPEFAARHIRSFVAASKNRKSS